MINPINLSKQLELISISLKIDARYKKQCAQLEFIRSEKG